MPTVGIVRTLEPGRAGSRRAHASPRLRRSRSHKPATESLDTIVQPAETGNPRPASRRRSRRRASSTRAAVRAARTHVRHADACRVLRDVRQRLGDDVIHRGLEPSGRQRSRSSFTTSTGDGARPARASSAGPRPRSVRIAGWSPRASSRSSCERKRELLRGEARGAPSLRRAQPGAWRAARRSAIETETRRCCAPSCRLRSSRCRVSSRRTHDPRARGA